MAIVVTGATGQLGALVVRHLVERGARPHDIVAGGRDRGRLKEVAVHGVRSAAVDYDRPDTLDDAFGRGDTVLLVSAGLPGDRVPQHRNAIEAARRAGVDRIVYTSITRADTVDTVLTPDHRATERVLADSGVPFTILRNNLYSDLQVRLVVEAAARNEIVAGWGGGRIAGAARDDYAEGAAAVLLDAGHDAKVHEFTGDIAWGGEELALAAGELLGKPITYASRTGDETDNQLMLAGVDEQQRAFAVAFDGAVRDGAFGEVFGTLAALLGRPTTPLVEALRRALPSDLPVAPVTSATPVHGAG